MTAHHFDQDAADRAVAFFEEVLVHTKGRFSGQPFTLLDWEKRILSDVFGWKREDGTRRYRKVYISVPKKNGKTAIGSGIGLYLTSCDGEQGAEVYSAAADKDQARLSFEGAKAMVMASPVLRERLTPYRNEIRYTPTGSFWKVLSADAATKHGPNPHGIIFDELHAQKSRDLFDTLSMGMGNRDQPLLFVITTAGEEEEGSIFCELDDYADQVLRGVIEDPSFYAFIARAPKDADWTEESTWEAANPSYGITVRREFFEEELRQARQSPARRNAFRRLYLNQRVRAVTRWIDLERWDENYGGVTFHELEDRLRGRLCYGGLDLSSKTDLTSLVLVFPPDDPDEGVYDVLPYFWSPEAKVASFEKATAAPYGDWAASGYLDTTAGEVIDYRCIRHRITGQAGLEESELSVEPLAERFRVQEIAFDRWGALSIAPPLEDDGLTMVEFGQGYRSMSEPTKELERLTLAKRFRHGAHPVLRWNIDCLEVAQDPAGNVKPKKPDTRKTAKRIDGAVALIMALSRALQLGANPEPESRYDEQEVRFV